jgi:prefoldin subunit 5
MAHDTLSPEPRRIENRWTWQGLLQLVGLVFAIGVGYAFLHSSAEAVPELQAKVETNSTRITRLETQAEYADKRQQEILDQLRAINDKLDRKLDR